MDRNKIIKELQRIKVVYGEYITKIGVFGSVARNEYGPDSDIDIIVEQKSPDLFLLGRIKEELEEKFDRRVDIIRLRKDINPFLKE